ncbi:hypothetical protein IDJ75_08445 [Mucilaginibacter rigui]|uniref:Uncharacterized protein n=1 Tax=Mucilaginibacter rigui TaxID=534635 RepID=A0ABR7X6T2_9SPHI|nr:hypothetical protein [Mucilaginibacter rigui]MBD1385305.1 hypothetical protein [Mucilaginibacter rigui]
MQEQFDVSLPAAFAIPENEADLKTSLENIFAPQEPAFSSLASAIQYENKPKFGPSAISNIRFGVVHYDMAILKGRLRVTYDMQLTFGCEDVIKDHLNQHSYYNFLFIPGQALLHFEGDVTELPSTAGEF